MANDEYSLNPMSPAFQVGFKPIDLTPEGLRINQAQTMSSIPD